MSTTKHTSSRAFSEIALIGLLATAVALVAGHPAIAETLGGVIAVVCAVWAGSRLSTHAVEESDPVKVLAVDLKLVLVVLLFLAGVTLIGLGLPVWR